MLYSDTKSFAIIITASVHRITTIKLFSVNNIILNNLSATFLPTEVLKH